MPRVFTLLNTRFRAVTPPESSFISPSDLYTLESCSDTDLKELSSRSVSVAVSFSSTVRRICSSFCSLDRRNFSTASVTVLVCSFP